LSAAGCALVQATLDNGCTLNWELLSLNTGSTPDRGASWLVLGLLQILCGQTNSSQVIRQMSQPIRTLKVGMMVRPMVSSVLRTRSSVGFTY